MEKDATPTLAADIFKEGVYKKLDKGRRVCFLLRSYFQKLAEIAQELRAHLVTIRQVIGIPSLDYKTISKEEVPLYQSSSYSQYLVEIPREKCNRVPNGWIEISATKAMKRYRTPVVVVLPSVSAF